MQVSKSVHAIKIPFKLQVSPGKTLDRSVYTYLIYGKQICLIDSGVSGSTDLIFNYIRETGRDPNEIAMVVFTHAHADHIGGAVAVQKSTRYKIAAHIDDVPWVEDIELQFRERPTPSFHSIVGGSVKVDLVLRDGDLDLGDGSTIKVIHTPGHSRGHIALLYEEEGVLFSGDSVPLQGDIPIYEDVISSIKSIKKLRNLEGVKVLLSSWDEPRYGDQIYEILDKGIKYIQDIHHEVLRQKGILGADTITVATQVGKKLRLPETALNPLFFKTIEAHGCVGGLGDISSLACVAGRSQYDNKAGLR